jgi:urocanate hydratase
LQLWGDFPTIFFFSFAVQLLASDPQLFRQRVQDSLRRQIKAINALADRGMFFWDYGNAFLLEAQRCGADVTAGDDPTGLKFRYPSYVQDIMG